MLLAVDVGNTQTFLGLFEGERLADTWRVATDRSRTGDELVVLLGGLLDPDAVDGICLSTTVPLLLREWERLAGRWAHAPLLAVGPGIRTGIPIRYDDPREVGPDRIVNAVAAKTRYGAPVIVVDFGTSTNFDVVSPEGEYVGGVLAPGIETSMDALFARAARLVKVDYVEPPSVIGKTTVAGLQSGLVHGFAGQVDGIVAAIRGELEAPETRVIATGGLAELVAHALDHDRARRPVPHARGPPPRLGAQPVIPDPATLAVFCGAALALLVVPGPAVLYIVAQLDRRRAPRGRRVDARDPGGRARARLRGCARALRRSLAASALAFDTVKYLGAAYLVAIGLWTLFRGGSPTDPDEERPPTRYRRRFAQGVVVQILNPKTALFFLAFLPQFVDQSAGRVGLQMLFLGLIFVALAIVSDGDVGARRGDGLGAAPRARRLPAGAALRQRLGLRRPRRRDGAHRVAPRLDVA